MIVVDTSVWIDFYNGILDDRTQRVRELVGSGTLLMGDLIACEILQGVGDEAEAVRVHERIGTLPMAPMVGPAVAFQAARNYRLLRARGITVRKTIDLLIGTFFVEHRHSLIHNDRDFRPMVEHLGLQEA